MYCFAKMCRLCLNRDCFLINFKEFDIDKSSSYDKLQKVIPALITESSEKFPPWICLVCQEELNYSYKFYEKCVNSNTLLQSYSEKLRSVNTNTLSQDTYSLKIEISKVKTEINPSLQIEDNTKFCPLKIEPFNVFDEDTLPLDENSTGSNISIVKNEISTKELNFNFFYKSALQPVIENESDSQTSVKTEKFEICDTTEENVTNNEEKSQKVILEQDEVKSNIFLTELLNLPTTENDINQCNVDNISNQTVTPLINQLETQKKNASSLEQQEEAKRIFLRELLNLPVTKNGVNPSNVDNISNQTVTPLTNQLETQNKNTLSLEQQEEAKRISLRELLNLPATKNVKNQSNQTVTPFTNLLKTQKKNTLSNNIIENSTLDVTDKTQEYSLLVERTTPLNLRNRRRTTPICYDEGPEEERGGFRVDDDSDFEPEDDLNEPESPCNFDRNIDNTVSDKSISNVSTIYNSAERSTTTFVGNLNASVGNSTQKNIDNDPNRSIEFNCVSSVTKNNIYTSKSISNNPELNYVNSINKLPGSQDSVDYNILNSETNKTSNMHSYFNTRINHIYQNDLNTRNHVVDLTSSDNNAHFNRNNSIITAPCQDGQNIQKTNNVIHLTETKNSSDTFKQIYTNFRICEMNNKPPGVVIHHLPNGNSFGAQINHVVPTVAPVSPQIENNNNNSNPTSVNKPTTGMNSFRRKFVCNKCRQKFKSSIELKDHMASHDTNEHKCKICSKMLASKNDLVLHIKEHIMQVSQMNASKSLGFQNNVSQVNYVLYDPPPPNVIVQKQVMANGHFDLLSKYTMMPETPLLPPLLQNYENTCQNVSSNPEQFVIDLEQEDSDYFDDDGDFYMEKNFCTICNKKVRIFKKHMVIHQKKNDIKCVYCDTSFRQKSELFGHLKDAHCTGDPICKVCNEKFQDTNLLFVHMYSHYDSDVHKCPKCEQLFLQVNAMYRHMATDHAITEFTCYKCDLTLVSCETMCTHTFHHESSMSTLCYICGKGFYSSKRLVVHLRSVHSRGKLYICHVCGKERPTRKSLSAHMHRKHTNKTFTCDVCSKVFNCRPGLTQHSKIHSDEHKRFNCKTCGKKFLHKFLLVNHERIHTGEKPFKCETCGKGFTQEVSLVVHTRVHTGQKPYNCKECGKSYTQSYVYKMHMKKHHTIEKND